MKEKSRNSLNRKTIITVSLIIAGIVLIIFNYRDSSIAYSTFSVARQTMGRIQVKGEYQKDREVSADTEKRRFTFYMKDDSGEVMKIVLNGLKPDNFDVAPSIVVRGRMEDSCFRATEVLTKCPSKYNKQY